MHDARRDVQLELKALRLNGMAAAWAELMAHGGDSTLNSSCWLIEHLLQAEDVDRHMRSIAHQMKAARFPVHRDMAGFDFEASQVDQALIQKLADLSFTEDAQNVVLIGGPGTGKTHLVSRHGKIDVDNGGWNITKSPCQSPKEPSCRPLQLKARTRRPRSSMP